MNTKKIGLSGEGVELIFRVEGDKFVFRPLAVY